MKPTAERLVRAWRRFPGPLRWLVTVAALTGVYFAAARFGLRYWPGVAAGAVLANLTTMVPVLAALGIGAGNTLEAVIAAAVLRRAAGDLPRLESPGAVRALILAAIPLGALVSALVGVSSLAVAGALPESLIAAVAVWWAGDVLGGLVVAPALLVWLAPPAPNGSARSAAEVVALGLGTVFAAELLLGQAPRFALLGRLDYLYLLFPFVIWGALRFGTRGAALTTFMVAGVAVWHTARGGGPFIGATGPATLFATGCYLAAAAVTGLSLAAAVAHERGEAAAAIEQREAKLRVALDAARMGTWSWSARDDRLIWDDALRRVYQVGPEERIASYRDFIGRVHPEDRELVAATVGRALNQGGRLDFEFRVLLPDGRIRWIADQGRVVLWADGSVVGLTGVCSDVTDRRDTEEQLRQAHRMESVGRLAGGVAHEANNQMSVVMSVADLLRKRNDLTPEVLSDLDHVRRAAERTAAVTAQLLAFSRRQAQTGRAGPQRGRSPVRPPAATHDGGRLYGDAPAPCLARPGAGRPRAIGAGAAQSRAQRPRRDAGRRHAHDRDLRDRAERPIPLPPGDRGPAGTLRGAGGQRRRSGNGSGHIWPRPSSRSSPPRRWDGAPAWDSRRCTGS